MVGIRSRFRYFHHYLCSSKRRRRCERPRGHQLKNTSIALLLSLSFVLSSSSSSSSSVVLLFISIRMMWTMKFSRETRERVFDFILLGQIVTYIYGFISSRAVFCSLLFVSLLCRFCFWVIWVPRKKNLEKKHARKPFGKKVVIHQYEKVRHVKRVALIKLYPFHNTISNTHTHEVVVLCFE